MFTVISLPTTVITGSNQIEIEIVFLFKDLTSNYCTRVGFLQNNKLYISAVLSQEGAVSGSLYQKGAICVHVHMCKKKLMHRHIFPLKSNN